MPPVNFRRTTIWVVSLISLAVLLLLVCLLWHRGDKSVMLPVVPVETAALGDAHIYGRYDGSVHARQSVEIRARVEGYLEKITYPQGTHIKKGQPLFYIDDRIYEARVEKARAQLKKATVQADKAERDLGRIRPLYEQNAASQLDLDNAVAAYETARADEAVARADLTQAELTLGYTVVWSPIDGYISELGADLGALVGPSSQSLLAKVERCDTVFVDFTMNVPDYLRSKTHTLAKIQPGDSIPTRLNIIVNLADGTLYPYHGWVDFSTLQVDPSTGSFTVRATMPNPEHTLMPGTFVNVKMLTDIIEDAVELSSEAIETDENGDTFVFVVHADSIVERRYVVTGDVSGTNTIVERGVTPGEQVVIGGYGKVRHGMKVCPVATQLNN